MRGVSAALLGGQSQRGFVDEIPPEMGGEARTDVLPWKAQLWREVELSWVSHTPGFVQMGIKAPN